MPTQSGHLICSNKCRRVRKKQHDKARLRSQRKYNPKYYKRKPEKESKYDPKAPTNHLWPDEAFAQPYVNRKYYYG